MARRQGVAHTRRRATDALPSSAGTLGGPSPTLSRCRRTSRGATPDRHDRRPHLYQPAYPTRPPRALVTPDRRQAVGATKPSVRPSRPSAPPLSPLLPALSLFFFFFTLFFIHKRGGLHRAQTRGPSELCGCGQRQIRTSMVAPVEYRACPRRHYRHYYTPPPPAATIVTRRVHEWTAGQPPAADPPNLLFRCEHPASSGRARCPTADTAARPCGIARGGRRGSRADPSKRLMIRPRGGKSVEYVAASRTDTAPPLVQMA